MQSFSFTYTLFIHLLARFFAVQKAFTTSFRSMKYKNDRYVIANVDVSANNRVRDDSLDKRNETNTHNPQASIVVTMNGAHVLIYLSNAT